MIDIQWWRSGYDDQIHAFRAVKVGQTFSEALCEHSVPTSKITPTDQGRRCIACLLVAGDLLSTTQDDPLWRAS